MTLMTTWVEIPITVDYQSNKATGDGWHEPLIPEHIQINGIELADDLEGWILDKYYDDLIKQAQENER